jgi:hypothetical protein
MDLKAVNGSFKKAGKKTIYSSMTRILQGFVGLFDHFSYSSLFVYPHLLLL